MNAPLPPAWLPELRVRERSAADGRAFVPACPPELRVPDIYGG